MVLCSCLNPNELVEDTFEGSDCIRPFSILMRGSLINFFTRSMTELESSPDIMRKLMVAFAFCGITLSFTPALKMVGAVVVRTRAFPGPVFS